MTQWLADVVVGWVFKISYYIDARHVRNNGAGRR